MLAKARVVIISLYISVSNLHAGHLKIVQWDVSIMSHLKLEKCTKGRMAAFLIALSKTASYKISIF